MIYNKTLSRKEEKNEEHEEGRGRSTRRKEERYRKGRVETADK